LYSQNIWGNVNIAGLIFNKAFNRTVDVFQLLQSCRD